MSHKRARYEAPQHQAHPQPQHHPQHQQSYRPRPKQSYSHNPSAPRCTHHKVGWLPSFRMCSFMFPWHAFELVFASFDALMVTVDPCGRIRRLCHSVSVAVITSASATISSTRRLIVHRTDGTLPALAVELRRPVPPSIISTTSTGRRISTCRHLFVVSHFLSASCLSILF